MSQSGPVVAATANPHKLEEIAAVLGDAVDLRPRPADIPEVVEDGATLEDNARLKAVAVSAATGLPALADDTGLEVVALGGAPGVHSARYAGAGAIAAENVARLLRELTGVNDRRARFRTVLVLRCPDGREIVAEGSVRGTISESPRGGVGGFGYDPIFVPDGQDGRTFAEMTAGEKNAISHRARALQDLLDRLGSG